MKRIAILLLALAVTLLVSQCSKITGPDAEIEAITLEATLIEIDQAAQAIDDLDEQVLTDTTDLPRALERALNHLGHLIERVHTVVDTAGNATADSLMEAAGSAQNLALDAAAQDSLRLALGYIRESRHLALEALRVILGEDSPPRYIEHLWADLDIVMVLADQVHQALQGQTAPVARRLFERGLTHMRMAKTALQNRQPRRAHAHLHMARTFLKRARERLSSSQ